MAAFRRHGRTQVTGVIERVNELAVAREILADDSLSGAAVLYEPEIVAGGTRFDFVATKTGEIPLYIEVKTVEPRTEDNEKNWEKVERRQQHVTPGVHYIVDKQWMGATIFNNSFSARSSFLTYAIETEAKLKGTTRLSRGALCLCFAELASRGTSRNWRILRTFTGPNNIASTIRSLRWSNMQCNL